MRQDRIEILTSTYLKFASCADEAECGNHSMRGWLACYLGTWTFTEHS